MSKPKPGAPLSQRQRTIAVYIANDYTDKEMARALNLAPGTIARHRRDISVKLGGARAAGITRYAVREGLVTA